MYNFRISAFHTYFVGCEAWGFSVWAHNAYTGPLNPTKLSTAARKLDGGDLAVQVPMRRGTIESVFDKAGAAGRNLLERLGIRINKKLALDVASEAGADTSHIIYVLKKKGTDEIVYTGRATGAGTPADALAARFRKGHKVYDPARHDAQIVEVLPTKNASHGAEEVFIVGLLDQKAPLLNDPRKWGVGYDNMARATKALDRLQDYADVLKSRQ